MQQDLPHSQMEVPSGAGEIPLTEGPNGYPDGFGPPSNAAQPQQPGGIPSGPETNVKPFNPGVPPQPTAPMSQGNQGEGQPNAPHGSIWDGIDNMLPSAFTEAMEADPNATLPSNTLYPPGLQQEAIDQWKERYGKSNVYIVSVIDDVYVFRGISRVEWSWVKQQQFDQETFENQLVWACMLWPKIDATIMDAWPAGICASMTEYVMRYSGFGAAAQPVRL